MFWHRADFLSREELSDNTDRLKSIDKKRKRQKKKRKVKACWAAFKTASDDNMKHAHLRRSISRSAHGGGVGSAFVFVQSIISL